MPALLNKRFNSVFQHCVYAYSEIVPKTIFMIYSSKQSQQTPQPKAKSQHKNNQEGKIFKVTKFII